MLKPLFVSSFPLKFVFFPQWERENEAIGSENPGENEKKKKFEKKILEKIKIKNPFSLLYLLLGWACFI